MSYQLRNLIQTRSGGLQPVVDALNALLESVQIRYNSETGPRAFGRPPTERIPIERKQLITFRGRLGGLIEYQFGTLLDSMLQDEFQDDLRLSFVVSHQYPDFYVRDAAGNILLRVDFKTFHDEADEYSSRFTLPITDIQPDDDLIVYVAWRWTTRIVAGNTIIFPEVLEALCIPAIEVATERDERVRLTGGHIGSDGKAYVRTKARPGQHSANQWSPDTNYGKVDRIVHRSRQSANLTPNMRQFLVFARRYITARAGMSSATGPTSDEGESD